jgi:uncharacterized membrane protein
MLTLLLGIVVFLGAHTFTTFRTARANAIAAVGAGPYRLLHSLVAFAGFVVIVVGFHNYRADGWIQLWTPPVGMRHLTVALMWFAFVALASMGKRPSRIRGWLRHPMLVAIKIWALAHLLANGDAGGMLLFASFLAWAVYDRIAVKRRGDLGAGRVAAFTRTDLVAVVAGTLAYVVMMALHPYLIGVAVFG